MDFARCPTQLDSGTPKSEPFCRTLNVVKYNHPGATQKHVSFNWEQPRDHDLGSNRIQGMSEISWLLLVQLDEMIVLLDQSVEIE